MPSIHDNQKTWQEVYDWSHGGDEWSRVWGGEDTQWFGVILPRIHAFVTDAEGTRTPCTILEIAPGFGRWTKYLKNLCDRLIVVDLAPKCIEACRQRFRAASHIDYHVNDGKSLDMVPDRSIDFVFSMDSLVHAEEDVVEAYLSQMKRIQTRNAVGFIHHSNFGEYLDQSGDIPNHGRARTMTARKFKDMAADAGLKCLSQELMNWGTAELIDAFSVFVGNDSDWNGPYKQFRNENFMNEAAHRAKLAELYGRPYLRGCVTLPTPSPDPASFTVADEVAGGTCARAAQGLDPPMGNIDVPLLDVTAVSRLRVSGWAGDSGGILEVRVLLDGEVVARPALTVDRPDVSAMYPEFRHGTDYHGWCVDVVLPAPGTHRLSVQALNVDGISVEIGARIVSVPEAPPTAVAAGAANNDSLYDEIAARRWFYDFDLPNGSSTRSYLHESVAPIHQTRLEMLWRALDPIVEGRWTEFSVIDIACHQGYFATHLARRGCRSVLAVDARPEHVESARVIARAYDLTNLTIEQRDVSKVSAAALGLFDITLLFGLLYHVENPVGLLRLARQLTQRVCLVETQIAPDIRGSVDWGSRLDQRPIMGTFCIVDETGLTGEPESNLTEISLCPSLDAVLWTMRKVGFSRAEVVPPAPHAYEQLASGARVVVAGFVD